MKSNFIVFGEIRWEKRTGLLDTFYNENDDCAPWQHARDYNLDMSDDFYPHEKDSSPDRKSSVDWRQQNKNSERPAWAQCGRIRVPVFVSVHSFEIPNQILSDRVLVVKIVSARVLVVKIMLRTLFPQE